LIDIIAIQNITFTFELFSLAD